MRFTAYRQNEISDGQAHDLIIQSPAAIILPLLSALYSPDYTSKGNRHRAR
jgi:hypothetical protein